MQETDDRENREIDEAEEKRRSKLAREENALRELRRTALAKKEEAARKANVKWKQAVDKARAEPLSEQRRLRLAADEALERALEEIRDSYSRAIEETRLSHQAAVQDPDPLGLSVTGFHDRHHFLQGGRIMAIARKHLISQG